MSLINEALKKAQRQRSLDAAPLSSAPSGIAAAAVTTHERTATHRRSHAPVWFGLGLLVLGAGATALIMHYGRTSGPTADVASTELVAVQPVPVAVPATPLVPQPAPAALPPSTLANDAAAVVLPPIAPVAQPPPEPPAPPRPAAPAAPVTAAPTVVQSPPPAPAATPAPVPVTPVAVKPVVASPSAAESEAKVYAFLDTARITGVRGTGPSARVLMNERVYRLNDLVHADPTLRLSAVRKGVMVFTDAQGKTYEKPY